MASVGLGIARDRNGSSSEKDITFSDELSSPKTWIVCVCREGWVFSRAGESALEALRDQNVISHEYGLHAILVDRNNSANPFEAANTLLDRVMSIQKHVANERHDSQNQSIVFICDDLGGLLVKQALIIAYQDPEYSFVSHRTQLLVFFGTPHRVAASHRWPELLASLLRNTEDGDTPKVSPEVLVSASHYFSELLGVFYHLQYRYQILDVYQKQTESKEYPIVVKRWEATIDSLLEVRIARPTSHTELGLFSSDEADSWDILKTLVDDSVEREARRAIPPKRYEDMGIGPYPVNEDPEQPAANIDSIESLCLAWLSVSREFLSWKNNLSSNFLLLQTGNCLSKRALSRFMKESSTHTSAEKPIVLCFDFGRDDGQYGNISQLCLYLIFQVTLLDLEEKNHIKSYCATPLPSSMWTERQLWGVFKHSISLLDGNQPIFLILNDLGKCEPSSMWFLEDLARFNEDQEQNIKVLISDAPIDIEGVKLDLRDSLSPAEEDTTSIVDVVLQSSIREQFKKELLDSIKNPSRDSVQGSNILVQYLELSGIQWLRNQPQLMTSTDSTKVVTAILERVPPQDMDVARQIFMWLCFACRSLELNELETIVKFSQIPSPDWYQKLLFGGKFPAYGQYSPDQFSFPNKYAGTDFVASNSQEGDVIGGLNDSLQILIQTKGYRARFIDASVRKVFTNAAPWEWYFLDEAVASKMLRSCLSYICQADFQDAFDKCDTELEINRLVKKRKEFAFFKYAVKYWPQHYIQSVKARSSNLFFRSEFSVKDNDQLVLGFLSKGETLRNWYEIYWKLEDPIRKQNMGLSSLSPLTVSCRWGFLNLVEELIPDGAGAGFMDHELALALETASQSGHDEIVEYLMRIPQLPTSAVGPSITAAAEGGHGKVLLRLLKSVSNAFELNRPNYILFLSAGNGDLEAVKYLVDKLQIEYDDLAPVKSLNQRNLTPVQHAAKRGHAEIIQFLGKERAVKANEKYFPISPLQLAVGNGHVKAVEQLLAFGLKPGREQPSVLLLAAQNGHKKIMEKLLGHAPSLDSMDELGRTPLHISCSKRFVGIGKMLIEKAVNLDLPDKQQNTALHLAAKGGSLPLIQLLLEKGSQITRKTHNGDTPLHLTLIGGNQEASIMILEKFVSTGISNDKSKGFLNDPNHYGQIPLMLALENSMSKVAAMLLAASKKDPTLLSLSTRSSVLKKAAEKGYSEIVKIVLELEASSVPKVKRVKMKKPVSVSSRFIESRTTDESEEFEDQRRLLERLSARDRRLEPWEEDYRYIRETRDEWRREREPIYVQRSSHHDLDSDYYEDYRPTFTRARHPSPSRYRVPLPPRERFPRSPEDYPEPRQRQHPSPPPSSPRREIQITWLRAPNSGSVSGDSEEDFVFRRRRTSSRSRDSRENSHYISRYGRHDLEVPYYRASDISLIRRGSIRSPVVADSKSASDSSETENESESNKFSIEVIATALGLAAAGGHVKVVEEILKAKAEVKNQDNWFHVPLSKAVELGHDKVVEHITGQIGLGIRVASAGENLGSFLRSASKLGHLSIVKMLLNLGVDVDSRDAHQNTALQLATFFRKDMVVRLLLLRRADITLVDESGNSALSDGAYRNSTDALELLLEAGADSDIRNNEGKTPLIRAIENGNPYERTIALLLEAGADIDAVASNNDQSPLQSAAQLNNIETDKLILRAGVQRKREQSSKPVTTENDSEKSVRTWNDALKRAIYLGRNVELVELLIDNGAELNTATTGGDFNTPILKAIYGDQISIIRLLLDRGAHIDSVGNYGTPLQYACWLAKPDIVDMILQYSPDVNKTGGVFHTAIQAAAYYEYNSESIIRIVKSLLGAGASTRIVGGKWGTALHASVAVSSLEVARTLLDHEENSQKSSPEPPTNSREISDAQGRLPLHIAAQSGSLEIIDLVRPTGKDSDFERTDRQLRTPLHFAAAAGSVAVIKMIRDVPQKMPSPFYELQDIDGWTPLHWALRQRNMEAVEMLTRNESELNRKCLRGWTPRHVAALHGNEDIVERLIKKLSEVRRPEEIFITTEITDNALPLLRGVWRGYGCDGCSCDIYGDRYHCQRCYDWDFCFKCFWTAKQTHYPDDPHEFELVPQL